MVSVFPLQNLRASSLTTEMRAKMDKSIQIKIGSEGMKWFNMAEIISCK